MARLYADENFNYSAVLELRKLGHDVLAVQEAGRRGHDDPTVLADAKADGRAVITHNRFHFVGLHRRSSAHAGIIVATDDTDGLALAVRIDAAITTAGPLTSRLIRVNRPANP
jgi:hypothetical protein